MKSLFDEVKKQETYPLPDIGICSICGEKFKAKQLQWEWESDDWEPNVFVANCPVCEDGGCINDWQYSKAQWKKYLEWEKGKEG